MAICANVERVQHAKRVEPMLRTPIVEFEDRGSGANQLAVKPSRNNTADLGLTFEGSSENAAGESCGKWLGMAEYQICVGVC